MKAIMSLISRDESGKILILALVLLVVGVLLLTPLLGLMSTGLIAGQVHERKTAELYAADAGVEDALWRIRHGIDIPTDGYGLAVNGRGVWVTVETKDTTQFLVELLEVDEKNWPHSEWTVVGKIERPGEALVQITWDGSGNQFLTDVGMWVSGNFSYVEGQPIPEDDIRNQNTDYEFEEKSHGEGTAFIWTWPNANQSNGPSFKPGQERTLAFEFSPADVPGISIAFTMAGRQDVGLSHDGGYDSNTIRSVATTDTASQTTVVASAVRRGCDGSEMVILSWSIS